MEPDWPRIAITLLTVAAFVLSATGLLLIRRDTARGVKRMDADRAARTQFSAELHEVTHDPESTHEEQAIALTRWRQQHAEAGIEAHTYKTLEEGREVLAERIIRELEQGSRVDVVLVGLGLLCGLAASIWGTWLPQP